MNFKPLGPIKSTASTCTTTSLAAYVAESMALPHSSSMAIAMKAQLNWETSSGQSTPSLPGRIKIHGHVQRSYPDDIPSKREEIRGGRVPPMRQMWTGTTTDFVGNLAELRWGKCL